MSSACAEESNPIGRNASTASIVVRSMSSSIDGVIAVITASTARPAATTSSKTATAVIACGGIGRSRKRAMVTIPNVPSLPTMSPARSYPATPLTVRRPRRVTRPSASTTSSPRTASRVTPYFTQHSPPALVLTLPPMEQKSFDAGSGAYHRSCFATCSRNSVFMMPGWVSTYPSATFTSRTSRMRSTHTMSDPSVAFEPPERPLPAPRGTTGTRCSCAARSTAATCSVERGKTAAIGCPTADPVDRSREYVGRMSGSVTMSPSASAAAHAARTASSGVTSRG